MSWSTFSGSMVRVRHKGRSVYVATMPLDCPNCGLRWSDEGLIGLRGNVYRGWGCAPGAPVGSVLYECRECGHHVYESGA